jgi:uncharacterized protein YfcZ (UPF0381/DUF406 family)
MNYQLFSNNELFAIIMETDKNDTEKYRPILNKISDTTSYIYLFKIQKDALSFLKKYNIPEEKCKIVKQDDKFIQRTIKDLEDKVNVEFRVVS